MQAQPQKPSRFFFENIDSTNPLLALVTDTLRRRNKKRNFTNQFIRQKGYPVWNAVSIFPQQGQLVVLVPIISPVKQMLTGILDVNVKQNQPVFRWIPRSSQFKGPVVHPYKLVQPHKDTYPVETTMLRFEQKIFGQVQTQGITVIQKDQKKCGTEKNKFSLPVASYYTVINYNCGRVCVPDYCGPWECDTKTVWIGGGGGGSGTGNGNGSGLGGGSGSGGGGSGGSVGSGGGTTVTGGSSGSNIITSNPEVKYPEGSNYSRIYPKLTEYLKNQLPTLKDNATIINAIIKYTSLSKEQISHDLQWGKGPTIKIVQLDNACSKCNTNTYGLFDSNDPNTLDIDIDLVNELEQTETGSVFGDAWSFLVGVTILHEYVHFGDNFSGIDYPGEEGLLFEKDVYGDTVWKSNAAIILNRK